MRKIFLICAVLMAAMTAAPLAAMDRSVNAEAEDTAAPDDGFVNVMLSENGKIERYDEREYIIGVLAAEMDISCHEEALKAQVCACYTYMRYMKDTTDGERFNGADVSDDSAECQGYLDENERREKWGENFEGNEKKAEKAVDAVLGKLITYEGKPILAAYHGISAGATEDAETVWGKDYPYLKCVESAGDRLSADYSKTVVLSLSDFTERVIKIKDVNLSGDAENWLGKVDTSENGYVKSLYLGSTKVSGADFRKAFELPSCNFTISYDSGKFTVRTLGSGHQVGMSQYGADYMARQGFDWKEILEHYYANVEIM